MGTPAVSGRASADMLTGLDMYSLVRCRVISRGRRGRTREITLELPEELVGKIRKAILMHFELRG
jgi:Cdc6-like AAA superfamily ATPase